ncbi:hypothetical protein [Micavibrio aeruginosavorus]|uniref:Uncharacterized protein n=1 Tax=Micavibrio aeruginosavorus EPB TaxID=349215 RepID=M4VG64_9BACT|nr:hypothetical protein [Micavibrio aeruginosavorus]AGH98208.1 hypothetical protein A11S_1399 [Micavibrio aeruginosavorus EPB]
MTFGVMTPDDIKKTVQDTFEQYGTMGLDAFKNRFPAKAVPGISHLCVEFTDEETYAACAAQAQEWGSVSVRPYNGRDITWCRLKQPFVHGDLTLYWLELLQPVNEPNDFNGVTSIVYAGDHMERVEKLPGPKNAPIRFRYQKFSAETLAR